MNANDIEKLYKKLKEDMKVRNWSDFAKPTGYTRTHISEVVNGSKSLTVELEKAINQSWLKQTKDVGSEHEKYVQLLEETNRFLKESVEFSLSGLSADIIVNRATMRAGIEYQVMKDSKGNEKTREVLMGQINKLIHSQLTGGQKESNSSVAGK